MPEQSLSYHLNSLVTEVDSNSKTVKTAKGDTISYDFLVLATGSNAVLPRHTPGHDAKGVFVYRTIEDLENLISFSSTRRATARPGALSEEACWVSKLPKQ
jgi:nitrite reductase (NAD(P)H)